ncbi:hypothetical protein RFI_34562 [Reticulomyxa filosa]|uniref:Uncharacterized protein n=1 Tax=Reticulomyxa filosa TaxID=46433 RepID=X6LNA5_RETFI|nr:hypothetical protein RFI_34562 [Reticulomyxa filosa]|eukprot:ETO02851.1 hypothetical protein RFI_34562 [Reticulomyxa filosa]
MFTLQLLELQFALLFMGHFEIMLELLDLHNVIVSNFLSFSARLFGVRYEKDSDHGMWMSDEKEEHMLEEDMPKDSHKNNKNKVKRTYGHWKNVRKKKKKTKLIDVTWKKEHVRNVRAKKINAIHKVKNTVKKGECYRNTEGERGTPRGKQRTVR